MGLLLLGEFAGEEDTRLRRIAIRRVGLQFDHGEGGVVRRRRGRHREAEGDFADHRLHDETERRLAGRVPGLKHVVRASVVDGGGQGSAAPPPPRAWIAGRPTQSPAEMLALSSWIQSPGLQAVRERVAHLVVLPRQTWRGVTDSGKRRSNSSSLSLRHTSRNVLRSGMKPIQ